MCDPLTNPLGCVSDGIGSVAGDAASSIAGNAIEKFADAISEGVGDALAALGTMWVTIGTPNVASGTSAGRNAGATPPGAGAVDQVLSYTMYVGLGICVLSLMVAGARMAMPHRYGHGEGEEAARVGTVLMATTVISGAAALISGLFRGGRVGRAGETVAFLQNSLWYYVLALAIVSIIVAGIKMAWEQRSQPGRDVVKSMLTLLLVTGAALPVLGMLVAASDGFAEWIITGALDCDPTVDDGSCFNRNISQMVALGSFTDGGIAAPFMVIVLGLIAILTSLFQIMLMVARAGMLVVLAGVLPLTAASTNTELGSMWFKRAVSWLVAWLLYKPAAAIVYAAALHLTGSEVFQSDDTGLIEVLSGLMLMILAIVALPALLRFVTPAVSSMASGNGGSAVMAAAAVPAMGAVSAAGRLGGSGGSDHGHSSPSAVGPGTPASGAAGGSGDGGTSGGSGRPGGPGGSGPSGRPGSPGSGAGAAAGKSGGASGAGAGTAASTGGTGVAVLGAADGLKRVGGAASGSVQSTAEGAANKDEREGR